MALPTESATTPAIQVAGLSHILIGFKADNYAVMHRIGMQMDDTRISMEPILHNIFGDSQGGPQGQPIEIQKLGVRYRVQFNLSKWDPIIKAKLEQHEAMATEGSFADSEIGALMLRDRSFRLAISPSKDTIIPVNDPLTGDAHPDAGKDYHFRNFCCCLVSTPIETGQGTKFSALQFAMEAYRVPEGHPLAPSSSGQTYANGLIWNRNASGIDNAYLPPCMRVEA
ncbi:MAG: hypothetical protein ACO1RT_17600 [Planctomycetaceae bacterium]